jgi:hypothetical protein
VVGIPLNFCVGPRQGWDLGREFCLATGFLLNLFGTCSQINFVPISKTCLISQRTNVFIICNSVMELNNNKFWVRAESPKYLSSDVSKNWRRFKTLFLTFLRNVFDQLPNVSGSVPLEAHLLQGIITKFQIVNQISLYSSRI